MLRETTIRGLCGLVCPSRTSEITYSEFSAANTRHEPSGLGPRLRRLRRRHGSRETPYYKVQSGMLHRCGGLFANTHIHPRDWTKNTFFDRTSSWVFLPLRLGDSKLCRSAHVPTPLSPSPHANSLVIGTAVINTHTFKAARTRYSLQRGKMPLCFWHGVTRRPTSPSPCAGGRGLDAREVANSSLLYLSPPPLPLSLPHSLSLISSSLPVPPPLSIPPSPPLPLPFSLSPSLPHPRSLPLPLPLPLPPTLPPLNTWDLRGNKQEHHYWQPLVWVSGLVQTLLYADFFYYYWIALKEGSKFQLPG